MDGCISFNIGKVNVNANQINLLFNEHRKLCHKDEHFLFEYGTIMGEDEILLVGHSITPKQNLTDYEFVMHTYINDQRVSEIQVNYNQVVELFTKENNSRLINQTKKSYLESGQSKIGEKRKMEQTRRQPSTQTGPATKSQGRKQKLQPGKRKGYVINPDSGAEIKINGPTYQELCDTGNYIC